MIDRRRPLRAIGETLAAWLLLAVIPWLPRGAVVALARLLARAGYRLAARERRVAHANVDLILGGQLDLAAREAIVREAFLTMALTLLDLFWFSRRTALRLGQTVRFDPSCRGYFDRAPLIAVSAHFGNWEAMGLALAARGAPCTPVFSTVGTPVVNRLIARLRGASGQETAERTGVIRRMLAILSGGGRVGVLLDQNTLPADGGVFVDFLGVPAPMSSAFSALAARTGAPVVPMFCRRTAESDYLVYALEPLQPGPDEAVTSFTQRIAAVLGAEIRRHPGQWLWMYKRWKYLRPGDGADRYPFYARPPRGAELLPGSAAASRIGPRGEAE
jgi:KDO2-lipid IV(A) lauroyltransferase